MQGKQKEAEAKLCEFEAKVKVTENGTDNLRSEDIEEKLLDLKQNLEEERTSWADERIQLVKQAQELQQESSDKLRSECQLDPVLVQTIRVNTADEETTKVIFGLTILFKELFIVNENDSEVEVYNLLKLSFICRWNLKDLIEPLDIGSCNINKCLYIFDHKHKGELKEILRIDPSGKLIKKWSTGDDWGYGLSVTDESNVILTVFEKYKLREYSPDGQLIRDINLLSDAGIRHPLHALKLTNGHFLVSHGVAGDELHCVCIVDAGGKLKKSYGGKYGSTIGQLNHPFYLIIDGNGFVMVTDQRNSRVLLLDSDLQFKREILSKEKHGLSYPMRILLDELNRRLFVVDFESYYHRILIFDIK